MERSISRMASDQARRTLDAIQELETALGLTLLPAHGPDAGAALPAFPTPMG